MPGHEGPPKLPNMNEFSPSVVGELGPLLLLVKQHAGNRERLQSEIVKASRTIKVVPNDQHLNRANNVLIGMSQCGLFHLANRRLTDLGERLAAEKDDVQRHALFAQHLLTSCHGNDLLEVIRSLNDRREHISLEAIRSELRTRGFSVTNNEGDASKIRLWLEKSRVIDSHWVIDEDRYAALMGISLDTRDDWQMLSRGQQAFLSTLKGMPDGLAGSWVQTRLVTDLCITEWGKHVLPKEADRRAKLINPLEQEGWLEARGIGEGRGGKGGEIRATDRLINATGLAVDPVQRRGVPKDLVKLLNTPVEDIYRDLESRETYKKGIALELLCLYLCSNLGLIPVELRKRGVKTQGAEVDLIAEGAHLHYSRWLFQCKNTRNAVNVEHLAREIGLAMLLRAHVVVMVTTSRFTKVVKQHAEGVARETYLQVVLIDSTDLRQIRDRGPSRLRDILHDRAKEALTLKAVQASEFQEDAEEG